MKRFFLIAVGGTGAKTAEAFIHLCAAGLGPERADILLIDVDQDNGNMHRTRKVLERYAELAKWPWDGPGTSGRFFRTTLGLHVLLDKLDLNAPGGLRSDAVTPLEMQPALNLFFDQKEQTSRHEKGFLARPNLGSLVMGGHLHARFAATQETKLNNAPRFLAELRQALSEAQQEQRVPVAVAGSIFGGTGASVFPVIAASLRAGMTEGGNTPEQKAARANDRMARVELCAIMHLPYFTPEGTEEDGTITVDPSRFLLDTGNVLKYYGEQSVLDKFQRVYLVGSDRPGRNVIKYISGSQGQANPPMIEEVVGALGLLHFSRRVGAAGTQVYAYRPGDDSARIGWEQLPWPEDLRHEGVKMMRAFLHLAAFHLYAGTADRPLGKGLDTIQRDWGADSADVELFPWFRAVLDEWGSGFESYRESSHPKWKRLSDGSVLPEGTAVVEAAPAAREYFARLLWWAHFALEAGDSAETEFLKWEAGADALPYWEAMCGVRPADIRSEAKPQDDNALVRILRTAAIATHGMLAGAHASRRRFGGEPAGEASAAGHVPACTLPAALERADLQPIRDEYQRTAFDSKKEV